MNKAARLDAPLAEATVDCYNEEWLEVPQDILDSTTWRERAEGGDGCASGMPRGGYRSARTWS